ncbi:hypothetical protein ACROYT_G015226 [Oculina patagonica]
MVEASESHKSFASLPYIKGTKEWIRKNLRFTPEHRGLLVWDSFRAHLTDAVEDLLERRNIDVAIIPGGLTPVLQPLDKCINKPFKAKIRAQYEAWMINRPFTYTASGKKSFKSCGINNALDETEDEAVWDDEEDETADADEPIDNEFETDSEAEEDE